MMRRYGHLQRNGELLGCCKRKVLRRLYGTVMDYGDGESDITMNYINYNDCDGLVRRIKINHLSWMGHET